MENKNLTDDISDIHHINLPLVTYESDAKGIFMALIKELAPIVTHEREKYEFHFCLNDSKNMYLFQCYATRDNNCQIQMEDGSIMLLASPK